jgi:hypothetical protein
MEDRVDSKVRWKLQLVCDRGDLGDDLVWTNEPMLKFLGGAKCLRCKVNMI